MRYSGASCVALKFAVAYHGERRKIATLTTFFPCKSLQKSRQESTCRLWLKMLRATRREIYWLP